MIKAVLSKEDPKGLVPITGAAAVDAAMAGVSLAAAVRVLRARRVSSAAAAVAADPKLAQACLSAGTAVEVSLSDDVFSPHNSALSAAASAAAVSAAFAAHPVLSLRQQGVPVALSCGSWLLSGAEHRPVDAAGEVTHLVVRCGLDWPAAREVVLAGFRHAFIPDDETRARLLARATAGVDAVLAPPQPAAPAAPEAAAPADAAAAAAQPPPAPPSAAGSSAASEAASSISRPSAPPSSVAAAGAPPPPIANRDVVAALERLEDAKARERAVLQAATTLSGGGPKVGEQANAAATVAAAAVTPTAEGAGANGGGPNRFRTRAGSDAAPGAAAGAAAAAAGGAADGGPPPLVPARFGDAAAVLQEEAARMRSKFDQLARTPSKRHHSLCVSSLPRTCSLLQRMMIAVFLHCGFFSPACVYPPPLVSCAQLDDPDATDTEAGTPTHARTDPSAPIAAGGDTQGLTETSPMPPASEAGTETGSVAEAAAAALAEAEAAAAAEAAAEAERLRAQPPAVGGAAPQYEGSAARSAEWAAAANSGEVLPPPPPSPAPQQREQQREPEQRPGSSLSEAGLDPDEIEYRRVRPPTYPPTYPGCTHACPRSICVPSASLFQDAPRAFLTTQAVETARRLREQEASGYSGAGAADDYPQAPSPRSLAGPLLSAAAAAAAGAAAAAAAMAAVSGNTGESDAHRSADSPPRNRAATPDAAARAIAGITRGAAAAATTGGGGAASPFPAQSAPIDDEEAAYRAVCCVAKFCAALFALLSSTPPVAGCKARTALKLALAANDLNPVSAPAA